MRLHLRPIRILASTPHPHASSTPPRNSPRLPRLDTQRISAGSLHPHAHRRRVARPARHSVLCAMCSGVYQSGTRGDPGPCYSSRLMLAVFVSPLSLASCGAAYAYYIVHHQSFVNITLLCWHTSSPVSLHARSKLGVHTVTVVNVDRQIIMTPS